MTSRATAGAEARATLARALLTMATYGERPVCSDAPQLWISDDAEDREGVKVWCQSCPLIEPCAAAGQFEKHGVWGGLDRTMRPGKEAA
ncbi:transcription factor WhiB [Branchiibius hedensis]|uniref:Transcription factor WhiB n=1 Tax=Branchiibius hedensis TaxID=672460 RepID=A0A2Y9BT73_9MICO|nr:WhiB family transcriptional regulator [Branchiibius hedensis]PWJ24735.1 transcription factor WhiB [Branchiibius hedensis]SSA33552.1 Transcription factor WhiB [Branchiibius hedensis]